MTNPKFSKTSDSGRYYDIPGYEGTTFYSVTTALNAISKPALVPWAAKQVAERAMDNADMFMPVMTKTAAKELLAFLKAAPSEYTKAAQERGTAVHKACEEYSYGDEIPDTEIGRYVAAYADFLFNEGADILAKEMTVFNPDNSYAGTLDAIVNMGGKNYVMDLKTGGVYPSASLQMAAYASATHYVDGAGRTHRQETPIDGAFVLELKPNKYKIHYMDVSEDQLDVFLAALQLSIWNNEDSRHVIGEQFK